jgi:hypothetical protein
MRKEQRYRYEMFVRVRDFGASRTTLFPPASKAGQAFATVTSAVAAIDDHQKNHVVGQTEARRVKATTRAAVFDTMKTIALAARRVTRPERGESPFRVPRRRSVAREIATARAFIEEAEKRQDEFVSFGLPPTFIADLRTAVDELQQAVAVRLSSKTVRRQALAGIDTELTRGFDAIRDLDVLVAIATRDDPTTFAAWTAARRIEGQGSTAGAAKPAPGAAVDAAAPDVDAAGSAEAATAEAAPASADADALAKAS